MKHIISFFIILMISAAGAREILLQNASPAVLDEINRIDRIVTGSFRLKKHSRSAKKLSVVIKKCDLPLMKLNGDTLTLELPERCDITKDRKVFRALVSALILSSGCSRIGQDAVNAVPYWLCCGILRKFFDYRQSERFLHGMHNLPAAEALYASAQFPDPAKLPELPADLAQECISLFMEYSRIWLETAEDLKMLQPYAKQLCNTADYTQVNRKLEKELAAAVTFSGSANNSTIERVLWNSYHPEPAARKLRKFRQMLTWQMPELDKDGNAKEKMITCRIHELPGLLAGRPDSLTQRKGAAKQIRDYSAGCTYQEILELQKLSYSVYNAYQNLPEFSEQISRISDSVHSKLKKRQQIEDFLFRTETVSVSPEKTLQQTLSIRQKNNSVTEDQLRFLLEIEKIYNE